MKSLSRFGKQNSDLAPTIRLSMIFVVVALPFMFVFPFCAFSAHFHIPSGNVTALIAAINTANTNGEDDVIRLQPGIYNVQSADNGTDDRTWTGLPAISTNITIRGERDLTTIIQREENASMYFRILRIEASGRLTLDPTPRFFGCF
jgi:hypothetical protein